MNCHKALDNLTTTSIIQSSSFQQSMKIIILLILETHFGYQNCENAIIFSRQKPGMWLNIKKCIRKLPPSSERTFWSETSSGLRGGKTRLYLQADWTCLGRSLSLFGFVANIHSENSQPCSGPWLKCYTEKHRLMTIVC